MPKDDSKSKSKKRKQKEKEDMDGIDEKNILPDKFRKDRKRKYAPPPSEDEDDDELEGMEDPFIINITNLLNGMAAQEEEETENEKYLKTLPRSKRRRLRKEEKKIEKINNCTTPIRYKILDSDLPEKTKAIVMQKVVQYENSHQGASGYHKLKQYMDRLLRIPFGKYHTLPVSMKDEPSKISKYLINLKKSLDESIYAQDMAKIRIMEVVAKWITNPKSKGNIIGLCGPPGIGKTTLIKKGLSKAINMPFAFMALGGCHSSATLEGHDYTYEGSKNGRLVDILIEQQCMNPIIFFDELDKLSETSVGREITGVLTHLTDSTQNDTITDRYFADIEFDFSKCLFIFSFNDERMINPILKDRITVINMKGFNRKEKKEIAKNFTLKKVAENIGIDLDSFEISDDVYEHIIDNYCSEEKGIRKLEKCIETLLMKLNLFKLTGVKDYIENVECSFPINVTKKMATKILNRFFGIDDGAAQMIAMMYT